MSSFPTRLFQQFEGSRRNCNEPNSTGQKHFENILDKLICEAYILYETVTFLRLQCQGTLVRSSYHPPPRKWRIVVLAVSFLLLVQLSLRAQVTIRDTIQLSPSRIGTPVTTKHSFKAGSISTSGSTTTLTDFIVMPKSGVLAMIPYEAFKLWAPLPSGSHLRVSRGGETITVGILEYLPCSSTFSPGWDSCSFPVSQIYYFHEWCESVDTFFLSVLKGDTLRTTLQAEFNNPTYEINGSGNEWAVSMASYACDVPLEGASTLYILNPDTVVRIVNHEPHEIWPHLPPQHNGRNRGANQPGYSPTRGFQIRVYDLDGLPVASASVRIKSEFVLFSGGHEHSSPVLPTNLSGLFYKSGSGSNPKTLTTDSTGTAVVDSFKASQIAGGFLITAALVSDSTTKDTVNMSVRVPNLVNFASIQTNYWNLTGNTGTTTACGSPPIQIRHSSNHYANQTLYDSLQAALLDFFIWSGSSEGFNHYLKLYLNDMSLERGGVFDICSNWDVNSLHSFHRVGASVDVNQTAIEFEGTATFNLNSEMVLGRTLVDWLTDIMRNRHGIRFMGEEQIHYGFGGGN